ncbi:hypothetical protein VTK73DRAFT_8857 [Phialemonium thermophilum]|uniref:Uncharacterized protein n=1 Tax=Phialemonium thermophilum TaxID=223376 RepID=A0ABR3W682_9PEZI
MLSVVVRVHVREGRGSVKLGGTRLVVVVRSEPGVDSVTLGVRRGVVVRVRRVVVWLRLAGGVGRVKVGVVRVKLKLSS